MQINLPATHPTPSPQASPDDKEIGQARMPGAHPTPPAITTDAPESTAEAKASSAPRNALLPRSVVGQARLALHMTARLTGGPVAHAANIFAGTLGGMAAATSLQEAAVGAALGTARASVASGTPLHSALKLAQLALGLVTGNARPRDVMVLGVGTTLDIAAGLLPGPLGYVADFASRSIASGDRLDKAARLISDAGNTAVTAGAAAARMVQTSAAWLLGTPR